MTNSYCGWFWNDGPVPDLLITALASCSLRLHTLSTDGTNNDIRGVLGVGDDVTADRLAFVDACFYSAAVTAAAQVPCAYASIAGTHV